MKNISNKQELVTYLQEELDGRFRDTFLMESCRALLEVIYDNKSVKPGDVFIKGPTHPLYGAQKMNWFHLTTILETIVTYNDEFNEIRKNSETWKEAIGKASDPQKAAHILGLAQFSAVYKKQESNTLDRLIKAQDWISKNYTFKKDLTLSTSSYGIKHVVEEGIGEYISEELCRHAFIALGYRVERVEGEANFFINCALIGEKEEENLDA